ncbi:MAG: nuclease superfamily protein [Candidatus Taylorbacteria bacterium]|nr:nuclease superfamily protein [Candidatus Taylorbacteria bacterium]
MQYVYILQSKTDLNLYIGCTNDIKGRLILHNNKKVGSTKERAPFILIHYEAFLDPVDAYNREKYLKTRWGRNFIIKNLTNFFNR